MVGTLHVAVAFRKQIDIAAGAKEELRHVLTAELEVETDGNTWCILHG